MHTKGPAAAVVVLWLVVLNACDAGERAVAPRADGGPSAEFDPESCTVPDNCDDTSHVIDSASADVEDCPTADVPTRGLLWQQELHDVSCPLGTCRLEPVQLAPEPDGGVIVIASALYYTSTYIPVEGGIAALRCSATGELTAQALWDFHVVPQDITIERRPSLLTDASGQLLYASARAIMPADRPRSLTIAPLAADESPRTLAPRFKSAATRPSLVRFGPSGDVLVVSAQRTDAPVEPAGSDGWWARWGVRASVTLFDQHGHARWNRVWPAHEQSTRIDAAHIDDQGNVTLLIRANMEPGHGSRVVQLARDGSMRWQRLVPGGSGFSDLAVASDGSAYVYHRSAQTTDPPPRLVERLDKDGQSTHVWSLPSSNQVSAHLSEGAGGQIWVTLKGITAAGAHELRVLSFDGSNACSESARYEWPTSFSLGGSETDVVALVARDDATAYISSRHLFGQLDTGGGAP